MPRLAAFLVLPLSALGCAHGLDPHHRSAPASAVPAPAGERAPATSPGPVAAAAPAATAPSLYTRLGGYEAIAAVTDDFLGRMLGDPQLGPFFVGHGVEARKRIRQLLVDQLCQETGGPCLYIGRDMQTTHTGLGITDAHWQAAVRHLVASLDKFRVPKREKDELLGAVSALKEEIVEDAERLKALP
jgi:hemoglobin